MALPKCPHCKYEFDDKEVWPLMGEMRCTNFPNEDSGETNDTHCLNCKATLRIEFILEPSWRFLDENNEELEINA